MRYITANITVGDETYKVKIRRPTKEEIDNITKPDKSWQTTALEVYVDRQIEKLRVAMLRKDFKTEFKRSLL